MNEQLKAVAKKNFCDLVRNAYPGRGVAVGVNDTGNYLVQICWTMGRSATSRDRVYKLDSENGRVYTEPLNPAQTVDPLTLYSAMGERGGVYVVSNGDQTDTVLHHWNQRDNLNGILKDRVYEPDSIATPRITATSILDADDLGCSPIQISMLRKSQGGDGCERFSWGYPLETGVGHCITTYACNGNPPPHFHGEPLLMPLCGGLEEILTTYWKALNEENRVSLAVKFIERERGISHIKIINQYTQNE